MSGIFVFICSYGNTLPSALLMHSSMFSSAYDLLKCEYPRVLGTLYLKPFKSENVSSFSFLMEKDAFTFFSTALLSVSTCTSMKSKDLHGLSGRNIKRICVCLIVRLRECAYH